MKQLKHNTLSSSVSKSRYSIPKAQRFYRKVYSYCSAAYYDMPSDFGRKRGAGFGYGNKSNFTQRIQGPFPGPCNYEKKSLFKLNKQKNKGKTFGISRNMCLQSKTGLFPGPANYKIPAKFQVDSKKYTMRAKTVSKYHEREHRQQPGPGKYDLPGLHKNGVYNWSKFKNSRCRSIGRVQRRDMNLNTCSPGPGQYNNTFSHLTRMSRVKNHKGYTVPKQVTNWTKDVNKAAQQTPGPGQYMLQGDWPDTQENMMKTMTSLRKRNPGNRMSKTSRSFRKKSPYTQGAKAKAKTIKVKTPHKQGAKQ